MVKEQIGNQIYFKDFTSTTDNDYYLEENCEFFKFQQKDLVSKKLKIFVKLSDVNSLICYEKIYVTFID